MQVDLAGRIARIEGPPSALREAIAGSLAANGATIGTTSAGASQSPEILVVLPGSAADTGRLARQIAATMPKGSRIVLVTSVLGLVPVRGEAEAGIEAAGIVHLTRSLAMELAQAGMLVNAIAAGAPAGEPLAARQRSHTQFGPPTPLDITNATLFLVDPASSYLTGHVLAVDGGWSAGYTRDF